MPENRELERYPDGPRIMNASELGFLMEQVGTMLSDLSHGCGLVEPKIPNVLGVEGGRRVLESIFYDLGVDQGVPKFESYGDVTDLAVNKQVVRLLIPRAISSERLDRKQKAMLLNEYPEELKRYGFVNTLFWGRLIVGHEIRKADFEDPMQSFQQRLAARDFRYSRVKENSKKICHFLGVGLMSTNTYVALPKV